MKRILAIFMLGACVLASARNPICPMGVYIADPSSRVAPDGKVSVYADDVLLGECAVPACADWTTLRARISRARGVHALKLVFESEGGSDAFAVDWLRFSRRRWGRR